MSEVAENPVVVAETNETGQVVEQPAVVESVPYSETLKVCNAQIFPSEEEGIGATIKLTFTSSVDGYRVNRETHVKEKTKVNSVSFFLSEVIKTMSKNFIVGSWMKSKPNEELSELLPVVLMGSTMKVQFVDNTVEQKMLKDIESVNLAEEFVTTMKQSVLSKI